MELPTYFADFVRAIRPTQKQKGEAARAHAELRKRLSGDDRLERYLITTFLQGSYRRSTDIKPAQGKKSDVDIIAVTNMDKAQFPDGESALEEFRPFLDEHYKDNYTPQGHSWGITDGEVELDLVPTSAPSKAVIHELQKMRETDASIESGLDAFGEIRKLLSAQDADVSGDEWRTDPLEIPDRERKLWERTHPLAQIAWTADKNAACNTYYVDVVRATKWWWLHNAKKAQPKGYALEAIVGEYCPNGITSVAEGFTRSLELIVRGFAPAVAAGTVPFVSDHGIGSNVLARVTITDIANFYTVAAEVARAARQALDSRDRSQSIALWREIFGEEFPGDGGGNGPEDYSPPPRPAEPKRERFAKNGQ